MPDTPPPPLPPKPPVGTKKTIAEDHRIAPGTLHGSVPGRDSAVHQEQDAKMRAALAIEREVENQEHESDRKSALDDARKKPKPDIKALINEMNQKGAADKILHKRNTAKNEPIKR